jgi:hypothetical protein
MASVIQPYCSEYGICAYKRRSLSRVPCSGWVCAYEVSNGAIDPGIGLSLFFPPQFPCISMRPMPTWHLESVLLSCPGRQTLEHGAPEFAACARPDDNPKICEHRACLEADVYGNCVLHDSPEAAWSSINS